MAPIPQLEELRQLAGRQGVTPTDEDLEAVRGFLAVLLPAFEELEALVPPGTPPAAFFLPEEGR
ncbi:MAG TPA: hypothetical protein VK915_14905 [Gaiellaceae bacterium]|nr:hypothetical protein [Gaiellaceae bacterium]